MHRSSQIFRLQDDLKENRKELAHIEAELKSTKTSWLEKLTETVSKISASFQRNMGGIGCAGQVDLAVPENPDDYDKYAIHLMVKFREAEPLTLLTANRQSGGERAVSTILYLVSLQDLTDCPFRVVDEINQGMDATNERHMFKQLVEAASRPHTPQCFILTPKLLPNLTYSDTVNVMCIFNGPHIKASERAPSGPRGQRRSGCGSLGAACALPCHVPASFSRPCYWRLSNSHSSDDAAPLSLIFLLGIQDVATHYRKGIKSIYADIRSIPGGLEPGAEGGKAGAGAGAGGAGQVFRISKKVKA